MHPADQEKDTATLRYDSFLSSDGTQCEVREAYTGPHALIAHRTNVAPALQTLFEHYADNHTMTIYQQPSRQLLDLAEAHHMTGHITWFSFLEGLEPASPPDSALCGPIGSRPGSGCWGVKVEAAAGAALEGLAQVIAGLEGDSPLGLVEERGRCAAGLCPVGDTAAAEDVGHFGCARGSFEVEARDARRDGLPRCGRVGAGRREPDRDAARLGSYVWPVSDIELDVDAGAVELEDRLAVADGKRAVDACGERLEAGDEGG
jgi:hypothetical protein